MARQRLPVSSSSGQVFATPVQMHRTIPTASTCPMAMTSRTLAVHPKSVSVPPMTPPLMMSITVATPFVQFVRPIRRELVRLNRKNLRHPKDDGIVPSTPVLLRPRTNDGQPSVRSQVNTRFAFGTFPELSLPTEGNGHLESQGMEDTRMDLSQLKKENSDRSARSVHSAAIVKLPDELYRPAKKRRSFLLPKKQREFEGGSDLKRNAATEIDLLGKSDQTTAEGQYASTQPEEEAMPTSYINHRGRSVAGSAGCE